MDKLGKTGRFPQGKIKKSDEGEIQLAVGADTKNNLVIIDFGTPVKWLGLPKHQAVEFAKSILNKAMYVDSVN